MVEYAFQRQGRPNGYIIGQEAGGAIVAGVRYGEGMLYTKNAGNHTVYWQGPSIGYDFGAEGSKTMILVYDLQHPSDVYGRFGGIDGSAYLVGGIGITFQQKGSCYNGTHPLRRRHASWSQCWIFEILPCSDLESILRRLMTR